MYLSGISFESFVNQYISYPRSIGEERLENYKTLAHPEIDKKRGFEEIINSPIYKNYVISEDGKTSAIVVY